MKELENVTELISYSCGNCGGSTWKIFIGHRTDGATFLNTVCANQECIEKRRQELQAPEDSLVVWDEFDISEQGKDADDLTSDNVVN